MENITYTENGFIRDGVEYQFREGQRYCHECGQQFEPDPNFTTVVTCPVGHRGSWVDRVYCPEGEVYTNLSGNTRISITWTPEDLAAMRSVKLERKAMNSQMQARVVPTALNYGQGWEFYNRPVYTPPNGDPEIWIEF